MKEKIFALCLCMMLCFSLVGCSSNVADNTSSSAPVYSGEYEHAVHKKFNSSAEENGLGGTKIKVDGVISAFYQAPVDNTNALYLRLDAEDGSWLISLGTDMTTDSTKLTSADLVDRTVSVYGEYIGYSGVYEMPSLLLTSDPEYNYEGGKIIDTNTGEVFDWFEDLSSFSSTEISSQPSVSTPAASSAPTQEFTTYQSGMYKVGVDIPAGEYLFLATSNSLEGYLEVSSDSSGDISSLVTNENFAFNAYATVYDGQYLTANRCVFCPTTEAVLKPRDAYTDGTYKIGVDLPAGEYKIVCLGNHAYYESSEQKDSSRRDIVANGNLSAGESAYLTVTDGQYFRIHGAQIFSVE